MSVVFLFRQTNKTYGHPYYQEILVSDPVDEIKYSISSWARSRFLEDPTFFDAYSGCPTFAISSYDAIDDHSITDNLERYRALLYLWNRFGVVFWARRTHLYPYVHYGIVRSEEGKTVPGTYEADF